MWDQLSDIANSFTEQELWFIGGAISVVLVVIGWLIRWGAFLGLYRLLWLGEPGWPKDKPEVKPEKDWQYPMMLAPPSPLGPAGTVYGRQGELSDLHTALGQGQRAKIEAQVSGGAGYGKTTLAREYMRTYAEDYRYRFWLDAEDPSQAARQLIKEILRHRPEGEMPQNQSQETAEIFLSRFEADPPV